eukprot:1145504-Pelagomonas_calceolata.AAC.3
MRLLSTRCVHTFAPTPLCLAQREWREQQKALRALEDRRREECNMPPLPRSSRSAPPSGSLVRAMPARALIHMHAGGSPCSVSARGASACLHAATHVLAGPGLQPQIGSSPSRMRRTSLHLQNGITPSRAEVPASSIARQPANAAPGAVCKRTEAPACNIAQEPADAAPGAMCIGDMCVSSTGLHPQGGGASM